MLKPNETVKSISAREEELLDWLEIVIISGLIFLAGIFLVGDLLFNVFYEQSSTFILEELTSGTLLGFSTSRYDLMLVFASELVFILKSWIFFSLVFYCFARILGEKCSVKTSLKNMAWSIYPCAWILFALSFVCLLLKLLLPLYYHYVFYIGVALVFIIFVPTMLQRFLGAAAPNEQSNATSVFKVYLAYYLTIVTIVILWSYNHYTIMWLAFL